MSKVLRCGLDGFVEFDLGSPLGDVWASFKMAQHFSDLAIWVGNTSPPNNTFFQVDNADTSQLLVRVEVTAGGPGWDDQASESGSAPEPVSAHWQECEVHYKPDGTFDFYVGGAFVFNGVGTAVDLADRFFFGNGQSNVAAVVFFDDVKIGTSRGASDLFSDDFESGDLSAWTFTGGDVGLVDDPWGPQPDVPLVIIKIYDLGANGLADISAIALEKSLIRVANGPRGFTVQAPASHPLLTDLWAGGDGLPILGDGGNRKLVVWEAPNNDPETDDPIFHGRIFGCERDGVENDRLVTITAFDPWVELGFETDERAGRIVRDSTGNFIDPTFTPTPDGQDGISGPDLIRQVLTYSQADPTTDPIEGEGPLPIDIQNDENWELDVPPALDLNPVDSADWPVMIGDFIQQLIATNAVDFDLRPIRPGTGRNLAGDLDDYIMVEASSKSKLGTDRSASVHFDYLTGSFNAKQARHVTDFSTHCAHLWYFLGPRLDQSHWRGDITPNGAANADLLPAVDASAEKYGGPGTPPGYDSSIRIFDSLGTETSSRPLYEALYRYEIKLRLEPRQLLYITPADGDKALFQAPLAFDAFDLVQIKADLGKLLDEAQRVYGYVKTWTRENVASIGQLQTSADVA